MRKQAVALAAVTVALCAVGASWGARPPSFLERATVMDAFNQPGRSWASRCASIRVSTVNPRYAMVTVADPVPRACAAAGEVGDGFELYVRSSSSSLKWRQVKNPCASRFARILEDVGVECF